MSDISITRLETGSANFAQSLDAILAWNEAEDAAIHSRVMEIIQRIRKEGDAALVELTRLYDRFEVANASDLELSPDELKKAWEGLPSDSAQALMVAAERIRLYADRQKMESWRYSEPDGTVLGQQVTPLDKVGVYVPGGKAAYPSSVLMNAIPAKAAGVSEIIMVVPTPGGETNPLVLAAAYLAGIDRVFRIGGAQAVAALAYGTATVPRVDKIVGPGNIYVATAKKLVFGQVGIDMVAGPSEILIISDGGTDPDWIAMDLFSQAEHDEDAQAILISPDRAHLDAVEASIRRLLPTMERADVIRTSLSRRGALIEVRDLDEAADVANRVAPEHLELSVEDPESLVAKIRNAGAIFMGRYTAEVLGDYCAGPNHVLPTSGTARFSSPLGVYDFQKRSSLIFCSRQGADQLARTASVLARGEGLTAHARSAEYRIVESP
ncbi:histidinol dehydrogenase [Methylocaldum szegediense]|uniref:Histidinol dehydrogenase n=1 Tax=Methylocaldum szegediense TaxID=73780 RepID=A0ABM9I1C4_9GAMM|nr:histidinol dehydrogenase [Methylocaldum szegediense]CAI8824826.1 Histidinol dehydrogenase [Methylocaldum szegediense]